MKKEVKFPLKVKINNNDQPDMTASIYKYELRTNRIFLEFYLWLYFSKILGNQLVRISCFYAFPFTGIHSFIYKLNYWFWKTEVFLGRLWWILYVFTITFLSMGSFYSIYHITIKTFR